MVRYIERKEGPYGIRVKQFESIDDEIEYWEERLDNTDYIKSLDEIPYPTPIQEFYTGSIFITGASGFLGICLLEKLLRACPNLKKIFILIRSKKDQTFKQRLDKIFQDPLFDKVAKKYPDFSEKVIPIAGEMHISNLGISEENRKIIIEEVNFIIHSAATVRFNERFENSIRINVQGASEVIKLATECKNLKSYVHISTAYANCMPKRNVLEEDFYKTHIHYKDVIQMLEECRNDSEIEELQERIRGDYLNGYTFSKALAENMIKEKGQHLPVSVLRPAVVVTTSQEPVRGWSNNNQATTGVINAMSMGYFRILHINNEVPTDCIPIDLVVNGIIAVGYETGTRFKQDPENFKIKVYNSSSHPSNKPKNEVFYNTLKGYVWTYPTIKSKWYPKLFQEKSQTYNFILHYLCHWAPYTFMELMYRMGLAKESAYKMLSLVRNMNNEMARFITVKWEMRCENLDELFESLSPDDKKLFNFDMRRFNWDDWYECFYPGLRKYLIKDPLCTLPAARQRLKRLYLIHLGQWALVILIMVLVICFICSFF